MAISWNIPALVNKIASDIPGLNTLLQKLATWNMDGTSNLPAGAKRMIKNSNNTRTIQEWNGTAWTSVGKLAHDVETVDGFSASQNVAKNAIPVRDGNGRIAGEVTGNAGSATRLLNKRTIGIAGAVSGTPATFDGTANITISTTALDVSKAKNGMLPKACGSTGRTDGLVTDVYLSMYNMKASQTGQLGRARSYNGVDANKLVWQGVYNCYTGTTALHWPYKADWICRVIYWGDNNITQEAFVPDGRCLFYRASWDNGATYGGWACVSRTESSDIHIYVAKDGSDANSGLEPSSPVLTWARAVRILSAQHSASAIYIHFGKGEWGSINVGAACRICTSLVITRQQAEILSSYHNSMPHFTYISDYQAGRVYLKNVDVDKVDVRGSHYQFLSYNRIGRIAASHGGSIYLSGNIDCKYINDTIPIFLAQHSSSIVFASPVVTLATGLKATHILQVKENSTAEIGGSTQVKLASRAVYSGKRCTAASGGVFEGSWNLINSWPGTGSTADSWGALFSGIPQDIAVAGNTGDRANAHRGAFNARKLEGGVNLNNYVSQGVYLIVSHNSNANLPSGVVNGMLTVYSAADRGVVKQVLYRQGTNNTNDHEIYVRQRQGNSWSGWKKTLTGGDIAQSLGSSTSQIPSCKAVKDRIDSVNSSAVHKTGNESIDGKKAFYSSAGVLEVGGYGNSASVRMQVSGVSKGMWIGVDGNWTIPFLGAGSMTEKNRYGVVACKYSSSTDDVTTFMSAYKWKDQSTERASISIVYPSVGTPYATCPTPPASSNSTSIATTAWVRSNLTAFARSNNIGNASTVNMNFLLNYAKRTRISTPNNKWTTYKPSSNGAIQVRLSGNDNSTVSEIWIRLKQSTGTILYHGKHHKQYNCGVVSYVTVEKNVQYDLYPGNNNLAEFWFIPVK